MSCMYTHFLHPCGQCTHIGGHLECVSGKCTLWVSSHQHITYNYRMWTCFSVRLKHLLGATWNWLYLLCCTSLCSNVAMFLAYIHIHSMYVSHKCTRAIAKTHMSFHMLMNSSCTMPYCITASLHSFQEPLRMRTFQWPLSWHRLSVATDCPCQSLHLIKCEWALQPIWVIIAKMATV